MEPMKKNKSRTAITIDPDLWDRAKAECERQTEASGRKVSFSALVERALERYLNLIEPDEEDAPSLDDGGRLDRFLAEGD